MHKYSSVTKRVAQTWNADLHGMRGSVGAALKPARGCFPDTRGLRRLEALRQRRRARRAHAHAHLQGVGHTPPTKSSCFHQLWSSRNAVAWDSAQGPPAPLRLPAMGYQLPTNQLTGEAPESLDKSVQDASRANQKVRRLDLEGAVVHGVARVRESA